MRRIAPIALALLAACGGGGEDSAVSSDPAPVASNPAPAPAPPATSGPPLTVSPTPGAVMTPIAGPAPAPTPESGQPTAKPAPSPVQAPAAPIAQPAPVPAPAPAPFVDPAPVELPAVTTRLSCTDLAGQMPAWWAEVRIDPNEFPWRSMWVNSQYSPYFESDAMGDIVNQRGIAAVPPPSRGNPSQPILYATVTRPGGDLIEVSIGASYHPWFDQFLFRPDGTMLRLLQPATENRGGTICTPAAAQ